MEINGWYYNQTTISLALVRMSSYLPQALPGSCVERPLIPNVALGLGLDRGGKALAGDWGLLKAEPSGVGKPCMLGVWEVADVPRFSELMEIDSICRYNKRVGLKKQIKVTSPNKIKSSWPRCRHYMDTSIFPKAQATLVSWLAGLLSGQHQHTTDLPMTPIQNCD